MAKQACTVCGRSGFWVGHDSTANEDRCVNHRIADNLTPHDASPTTTRPTLEGEKPPQM